MTQENLPEGWCFAEISDVVTKAEQRKPRADEAFTYVDIGSIDRNLKQIVEPQLLIGEKAPSRARKVINTGDILVSLTRPNLNAVALVPEKYDQQIASTGFEVIKPIQIDSRYIFALTRSKHFIDAISGATQGALYPAAKSSDVQSYNFALPPLAEQKIIAQKLDTLLAQVESTKARLERTRETLKRFRQSVLAAAVSGKLTEEWRILKAKEKARDITLDEVVESSFYGPRFGKTEYTANGSGVPTVRTTDMKNGVIKVTAETPRVMVSEEKLEQFKVNKNDLLITRTGSIGVMALFTEEYDAIPSAYLIRFRFKKTILPKYAYYSLISPFGQQQMGLSTTAITQPNINAKSIRALEVKMPCVEEQTEIVRRVEQLFAYADTIEKQTEASLAKVNILTQAILAKAFRGELTAQWRAENPELISGENSAEALLEKIKAERATLSPKKVATKKSRKPKAAEATAGT